MLRGIQEQLSINRQERSYSQPLARSIVDLVRNRVQLLFCAFGQVLANQSIHVFIAAPLPRAVRVAKVHRHAGVLCQLLVLSNLSALVVGERLTQSCATLTKLSVNACSTVAALAGLGFGSLTYISNLLVRSTKVPTALRLASPLIKSPSQCPGNCRSSISGGRMWMQSMSGI